MRSIIHMDLDSFFVSVSRLINPKLVGLPVIVGGGDRGVVAACSYETRVFGVHSAMPIRQAKRLCPDAVIIRGDYDEYSKRSDEVTQIIRESVPVYERSSIDEFYMDLTGMDRFFGCYKYATELRQRIMKETGLPISFGMSKNKTVSKIATDEVKPNNQMEVPFGTEKTFLAPLSVKKIPMIGEKTYLLLRNMGIEKVQTLQDMPCELLQRVLGDNGLVIWKKANGIDNNPVEPYSEQKSMSTEETFDQDTIDVERMRNILVAMTEKLCFRLRSENRLTSCITVKVRYSNFDTHTMQCRIPYTCNDHALISRVKELFEKLYNRRLLIRLIGVKMSHLVGGGHQVNMFEDSEAMLELYYRMDKMRLLYGEDKIHRAAAMGFSLRSFNPFNGVSGSPAALQKPEEEEGVLLPSVKSMSRLFNLKTTRDKLSKLNGDEEIKVNEYLLLLDLPERVKKEVNALRNELQKECDAVQPPGPGPHITLLHFLLPETEEEKVAQVIAQVAACCDPVEVKLKNFRAVKDESIYIEVHCPLIPSLVRAFRTATSLPPSRTFFAWKPRLTVVRRLNDHTFGKVKAYLKGKTYDASFITGSITLLKHEAAFSQYEVVGEFGMK
jgi:DNA polymerase IV